MPPHSPSNQAGLDEKTMKRVLQRIYPELGDVAPDEVELPRKCQSDFHVARRKSQRAWSGLISDERFNAILQRVETNREGELLSEPSARAATS